MDRTKLIKYAIACGGEYDDIIKAINEGMNVDNVSVEGINAITIYDEAYPKELLELKFPPFVLFYKGNLELLKEDKIGIVGSRNPSDYSKRATSKIATFTSDVVVSGLAKGIDTTAHSCASRTIAVLGCGIDYVYPLDNKYLFYILSNSKNGLILSEYPGLTKPLGYHFPFRNRIISALSHTLYVMECKQKSGTMTTVNEALELGRNVEVLPFDVFADKEIYNNTLISEGAQIIKL